MKKIITLLLCFAFLFVLAGCTDKEDENVLDGINIPEEDLMSEVYGTVEVDATKDAFNMLTGEYNMPSDRVGLRPYCVSVNNISVSWPQKGISAADLIIEMETEGGITRLMCLYNDTREVALIGSVRSLRDQFIEAIFPVDPIIVHIGTSIFADKALAEHNLRTIDGNFLYKAIYYDRSRLANYDSEHCKFTSGKLIYDQLVQSNFDEKSSATIKSYFNFCEPTETVVPDTGTASRVTFNFSNNGYDGDFRYDAETNEYLKFQRNKAQMDAGEYADGTAINKQLSFTNVFVLFANIQNRPGHEVLVEVNYQEGGEGYYFSNGHYEKITWFKGDYTSTFEFTKEDGTPLEVNTGKSIICMIRNSYAETFNIEA